MLEISINSEFRKRIDGAMGNHGDDYLEHLPPEITLIILPSPESDCEKFALGTSGWRHLLSGLFPNIETPQDGDTVLYYSEDDGTTHVGIYQADGTVISKWGKLGPVLRHPVEYVPTQYGEFVSFRRISEKERKEMQQRAAIDSIT